MSKPYNKALTLADRTVIQNGIEHGATKTSIADTIGKDKSTVGKEIKLHRKVSHRCSLPLECAAYRSCRNGRKCYAGCPAYVPFRCSRRDRSPGACNGCDNYSHCHFTKYRYDAQDAQSEYRLTLVESREGANLTEDEAREMAAIIKPALDLGHSPYQILQDHPELGISEKTLYNYIDEQVFRVAGIANIDLRRKVSRKVPKKMAKNYKKRQDRSYLKGRTYDDYLAYMEEMPDSPVVQMDTVYNDVSNGPFMQTFKFVNYDLLIAVYHDTKTADDMVKGLDLINSVIGDTLFNKLFQVLLTDRGSEFINAEGFEMRSDGTRRTRVFYCDPMASRQKGSLEVYHEQLRYICPKETNLRALGLVSQDALNYGISNIASSSQPFLSGKSPIEYVRFMCPELWEKLQAFGIKEIPRDEINLTPSCLSLFAKN